MHRTLKCTAVLLFLLAFTVLQPLVVSASNDSTAVAKADFILDVAAKIAFPQETSPEIYRIGIYGRGEENKALYRTLVDRAGDYKIHGKQVEVLRFKRSKEIELVDLIYVNGNDKIKLGEITTVFAGHSYLMVTQSFPYGTSMLNFAVNLDNELFFELQEESLKEKGAKIKDDLLVDLRRVNEKSNWEEKLNLAAEVIANQEGIIAETENQLEETIGQVSKKQKIIDNQRGFIILVVIFLLVSGTLLFLLYRTNKARKQMFLALYEKNKEITDSIHYAQRIQNAVLPSAHVVDDTLWEAFVLYLPKDIVAGDFYWLEIEDDEVYVAVADCTGHGVPGAMLSVICSKLLTKAVKELKIKAPAKILDKTVELLEERFSRAGEEVQDGMDIALCRVDFRTMKLEYAGAYNPLYLVRDNAMSTHKADKQPIGAYPSRKPFTNHTMDLRVGDCLYLFTDGFPDQFGGDKGRKFMSKSFRNLLLSNHREDMKKQKELLNDRFAEWRGDYDQVDDVCVMGIRVVEEKAGGAR